jgi:hypothetical protein
MPHKRPPALTFLCWLIITVSFVATPFIIAGLIADFPEGNEGGPRWGDSVLLALAIASMAIGPLSAYYMLRAKNWARWLYVILVTLDVALTILLFAKGEVFPVAALIRAGVTAPVVIAIVFLPASNRYFAARGRPLWMIEEEEDGR